MPLTLSALTFSALIFSQSGPAENLSFCHPSDRSIPHFCSLWLAPSVISTCSCIVAVFITFPSATASFFIDYFEHTTS
jgi:hypothetical protein